MPVKFIYILLIILCVSFGSTAKAAGTEAEPLVNSLNLKILTLNIHGGVNWYGQYDLDGIIKFINEVNPDIIGMQEVDRNWSSSSLFQDIPTELANRLQMYQAYSVSLERNNGYYGNLILSKYPIIQLWSEQLAGSLERRSMVLTQLLINGVRVNFITTHLGLSESDRVQQVAGLMRLTRELKGPVLISGDFNGGGQDPAVEILNTSFTNLFTLEPGFGGGTFRSRSGAIGAEAIDYIFASPELNLKRIQVFDNYISDHLPVLAEVEMPLNPTDLSGDQLYY